MSLSLLMFLTFIAATLGITSLGRGQILGRERLLRRRQAHHRLAERARHLWRLHERGIVFGDCRADRLLRLRRLHVFGRLFGRLPDRAVRRRRAATERREIHHGRRTCLPAPSAPGKGLGIAEHADRLHVLHDRPDGGRGCAGEPSASRFRDQLYGRCDRRRHPHDRLRRLRRDAGDDPGCKLSKLSC